MAQDAKILLAEDDDNDVFLMRAALERAEVVAELVVARDGQEAVEYLSGPNGNGHSPSKLRLMLLDLKMPRMDGFDVLSWIHNHPELSDLPVVVLSSSSQESDMSKARTLGARDYQVKPADFHELVRLVKELHARWLGQVA
ncbi:MAG: two-component system response regulator [Verrucomicrobia bacterium]|nr:MAG: two-component system response regulator [Verrucomicrobiota bacterium]